MLEGLRLTGIGKSFFFILVVLTGLLQGCDHTDKDNGYTLGNVKNLDFSQVKYIQVNTLKSKYVKRGAYLIEDSIQIAKLSKELKKTRLKGIKGQRLLVAETYDFVFTFRNGNELCFKVIHSQLFDSGMVTYSSGCLEGWYKGANPNNDILLETRRLLKNRNPDAELPEVRGID